MLWISYVISVLILLMGLCCNAMLLHSQNKNYFGMLRSHFDIPGRNKATDIVIILMILLILAIPLVNILEAISINVLVFMKGIED